MRQRYAGQGLVCLSVSVDRTERHDAAPAFLKAQKATFANYRLDEETAFWQEKWDLNGPPAVFVFDKQGKRAGKFDGNDPDKPYSYADVERLVVELLREGR